MIVVRDVFQLHFGQARAAIAALKDLSVVESAAGYRVTRLLSDVTGPYYTLVSESEFGSLSELEAALAAMGSDDRWRESYSRFAALVREGRREVFRVVA